MEMNFFDSDFSIKEDKNDKREVIDTPSEGSTIKFKGRLVKTLFPRSGEFQADNNYFGIVLWEIHDCIEGIPADNGKGEVVIKGNYSDSIDGRETYTVLAKLHYDEKYGATYSLMYYNKYVDLTKINNQELFLSEILTQNQVKEFFATYDNPVAILEKGDIADLVKIKGIGPASAKRILDKYEETKDYSELYVQLSDYGFTKTMVRKLIDCYRNPQAVVRTIKENPYELIRKIRGIGFSKADAIAINGGLDPYSKDRVGAYIYFYLNQQAQNGFSYVMADELVREIYDYFDGKENIVSVIEKEDGSKTTNIAEALNDLVFQNIITIQDNGANKSSRKIYLNYVYNLEAKIATELKRIMSGENNFSYNNWMENIKALEKRQGFDFAKEQLDGIKLGLDSQVCLISGLAGTGKTSLVSGILASLPSYSYAQTSLSGKAAARMQEVTGKEGQTIHRLLKYIPSQGFIHNEGNPLPYDIIILDEVSLVGGEIFLSLLKAISTGTKLIMLGDMGQLPSIGLLNLAADMHNSPVIPTVELTEVHRQASKSGIITSAHQIRNKMQIFDNGFTGEAVVGELQDMELDIFTDRDGMQESVLRHFEEDYDSSIVNKDIMKIQVIAPVRERGETSVFALNNLIQSYVNPFEDSKPFVMVKYSKDKFFKIQENDKVMCIKNNYKLLSESQQEVPTPVFNGWNGVVKNIGQNTVSVYFPIIDDTILFPINKLTGQLILGYATTVHKCVTGDTFIQTNKGIKQIAEIENSWKSLKVYNGSYFESPSNYFVNPVLNCKKITTSKGFHITGTLEHGLTVLASSGDFKRKSIGDIQLGDTLVRKETPISDFTFDTVVNIEDTQEVTYCLEMPETHKFIQNGFCGYNCQGSDYPAVIGVLDYNTPPQMLSNALLYTLITRAKKKCVLVGQGAAIKKSINTDPVSNKRTFLQELLERDYIKLINVNETEEALNSIMNEDSSDDD